MKNLENRSILFFCTAILILHTMGWSAVCVAYYHITLLTKVYTDV